MKKFLLAGLLLVSHMPCQATCFRRKVKLDTVVLDSVVIPSEDKLQKCIGTTALLLSTLSGLDEVKDKESVKLGLQVLGEIKKDLDDRQAAKELYDAIGKRDYTLARQLLKDKPNLAINARFKVYKFTALMQCCRQGDESINLVKDILKHPKLDITIRDDCEMTCLHGACYYCTPKITSYLLKREDISKILNAKVNDGATPLDWVVYEVMWSRAKIGHISIWNMLVTKGAQLSSYKDEYKQLNSDDFKPPYSSFVESIRSTPPKKVTVSKRSVFRAK